MYDYVYARIRLPGAGFPRNPTDYTPAAAESLITRYTVADLRQAVTMNGRTVWDSLPAPMQTLILEAHHRRIAAARQAEAQRRRDETAGPGNLTASKAPSGVRLTFTAPPWQPDLYQVHGRSKPLHGHQPVADDPFYRDPDTGDMVGRRTWTAFGHEQGRPVSSPHYLGLTVLRTLGPPPWQLSVVAWEPQRGGRRSNVVEWSPGAPPPPDPTPDPEPEQEQPQPDPDPEPEPEPEPIVRASTAEWIPPPPKPRVMRRLRRRQNRAARRIRRRNRRR